MISMKRSAALWAVLGACILSVPENLWAGGPLGVAYTGQPYRWDLGSPIPVNPDRGRLGKYGNAEAIDQLIVPALARWAAVPTARVNWKNAGALSRDIQSVEDLAWALDAGYNPIVFDQDGKIFLELGYPTQSVIGLGGFMLPRGETIVQGYFIINGAWVDGDIANGEMSAEEMINACAHEIGHFLNLGHSQVNGHMFFGNEDDPSYKTFGRPPADSVELMYPLYEAGIGTKRLTRDDEAMVSYLYPRDSLASFGSLSGTVRHADGYSPFQGANVVARNLDNPFYDAVAAVSGERYLGESGGSYVYELQGLYELRHLTPGSRYVIEMVSLLSVGGEGSGIGPRYPQVRLPGVEEFYSGASEASSNPPDDPMQYTEIRVEPGQALENLDFLCNRGKPEGSPTLITYGETSGSIDRVSEIDAYAFEARGYEYIRITAMAGQCCLDPALEVFAPDGRFLAAASGATELRLLLSSPGTYVIAVSSVDMERMGAYMLQLEKLWDKPARSSISYGETKTGNLAEPNQVDLYVIRGEAGDRLVASAGGRNWHVIPEVELLDPRGVILDRSSHMDNKFIDTTLPVSGEYVLAVRDNYGYFGDGYGLSVQRMNTPVNPITVQFGQTHSGLISVGGEIVTYSWSGLAGDIVTMRTGLAFLYLYDPDGVPLEKPIGDVKWTDQISLVLPKSGNYAVAVAFWTGTSNEGAFGFSVQRMNNPGNTTPVAFGVPRALSLTKAGEMVTYAWTSDAGDAVLLWLGEVASDDYYLKAELYDPVGILIAETPSYTIPVRLRANLEKAGRYSLVIYQLDSSTGEYRLNLQRLNNPGNAAVLAFGETRFASMATAGEYTTYAWTASAGDSLALRAVAGPASPVNLQVEVYDPDGLLIGQSYRSKSAIMTLLLPKTGRYTALVSDPSGSAIGPYAVAIQRVPRPGNALPLGFDQAIHGSLSQPGRAQSYQWIGHTGQTVTIRLALETAQSSALRVELFDPEGIVLAATTVPGSSGTEALIWEPLTKSGQYLLFVSDTEGSGSGSYALTASCQGCDAQQAGPSSELHFPFSSFTTLEYQGFAVCNVSPSTSNLRFTAYDTAGSLLAEQERELTPGSQVAFLPYELFGQAIEGKSGRVTVTSDTPNQKGFYLVFDSSVTYMDGSGSLSAGPVDFIMTESSQAPDTIVEVDVHNLRNFGSSPLFQLIGGDGSVQEGKQIQLPPLGSWSGRLDELFTLDAVAADSFVRCTICSGIAAVEQLRQGNSLAVVKAAFPDRNTDLLYSPQMAAGGGYFSRLSLVNTVLGSSRVWISLYDEQGKPHIDAAANPIARDIPPGGKIVVDVGEAFGFDNDARVHTGWLKIESDYGSLWGSISMGDSNRGSMTTLPLTGVGMREAVIPHVAQNSTYFTGIALLNFTKRPATVSLNVFRSDALLAGHATLRLAPGERVSKLINELIPVIKNQTGGYVRISSDQDLMVYAIFGTNSLSVLSAIPAQPVN
jgi:hypothetical protein